MNPLPMFLGWVRRFTKAAQAFLRGFVGMRSSDLPTNQCSTPATARAALIERSAHRSNCC